MNPEPQPSPQALTAKAHSVYERLIDLFGLPEWRDPLPAIDELISTILSQNTNDRNRDIAFYALKKKLPTWEAVRDADPQTVMDLIRPAGLANQKGPRLQAVLQQISEERGELSLDFLKGYSTAEAQAWLTAFKGVGPKTAAIVMQFALNMPAFPVDTHVYRVSGRLGLRPASMSADQAHAHLASLFDPDMYGPGHLNIIRLGREICKARKPACDQCPLTDLCDFYQAHVA